MTITVGIVAVNVKGGAGSGNWGHAGRPGLVGGSGGVGVPMMMGGRAGRAFVGKHLDTDVYKVSSSEVTPDKIDEWFARPGNEAVGLLYTSGGKYIPVTYIFLGRDKWSQTTPGAKFRYTILSETGTPSWHESFRTARAALEDLSSPEAFGRRAIAEIELVGGVWLESAKAFEKQGILLRLLVGRRPMIIKIKGGAGSGNWGHAGRPGLVGGSGGRGGGMSLGSAVGLYSATSPINISLREGRTLEPVEKEIVTALDAGMSPLDHDTVLYRGIRPVRTAEASEAIYGTAGRLRVGHEWSDLAYSSTSDNAAAARKIAGDGTIWRIHARRGQPALRLGPLSGDVGERETLLPRGTKFRLTGRGYDDMHDVTILDVEIV